MGKFAMAGIPGELVKPNITAANNVFRWPNSRSLWVVVHNGAGGSYTNVFVFKEHGGDTFVTFPNDAAWSDVPSMIAAGIIKSDGEYDPTAGW